MDTQEMMHIDIYTIILFYVSFFILMYSFSKSFAFIKNEKLRSECYSLVKSYSLALGSGDLIVWPVILNIIYPIYICIKFIIRNLLIDFIAEISSNKYLLRITLAIILISLLLLLFALLRLYFAYFIIIIIWIIFYNILSGRVRKLELHDRNLEP